MDAESSQASSKLTRMPEITEVRVARRDEVKLKAFASITLCDAIVVRNLKVIQGRQRLFVAMPSQPGKDGVHQDIVHPINREFRKKLEEVVLGAYFHSPPRALSKHRD